jgi:hypothetical protein
MSVRSSISRREPVIALKDFRYRGRNYKEGSFLDRRRTRMPNSKLRRFLRDGICIMAKDVNEMKLIEYGFKYDNRAPRQKLIKLDSLERRNQAIMDALDSTDPDDDTANSDSDVPTLMHVGGGWWDVMVSDKPINKTGLRKDEAVTLQKSYKISE